MVLRGGEVAGCAYASWFTLQDWQETSESNSVQQYKPLSLLQMAEREHLQVQMSVSVA